ncbi:MAG: hypothetical protein UU40_C0009G0035 [Candidatus Uhrbacteria bacterium GW2011_GWD2_41_121]|uniref:Uncharacterized protein n=1 Tax=Candidatus Uhrbacteria bacterium GW2011_GWC1_41_20 TaxID=1618983 RepID=A0A0G0VHC8_9BACT|nr:MAG: hypothetical protein UT52_C0012G0035 [Candidatus Uhrbacteria bacterium GW2011_GWE1_39_46]KKR63845.1 MAG: hypothetical protein UU04_C0010G0002 [Candidatus Uhrbacteria bacterium GW2011_GWC2_40_450]KKR90083.1 MAG: hypothetical protein UU40_C0009G0035 [Candidatus Uhrbacteria bacterium GW2011_GWD2_41_121]KKR96043.1 MAG: hypothetical protein UU46_C0009G0032 [Candidatus Uhrbacteria bacterium GW2011_GWD1_41_16]KKR99056.1 MAG: hypothetical protein UU50_C0011G0035 [Candidatus Uhrbacteria bacteriu
MARMSMKERFGRAIEDPSVKQETESSREVHQGLKNFLRAKNEVSRAIESWRQAKQEAALQKGGDMNAGQGFRESVEDQKQQAAKIATQWIDYAHQMLGWFELQQLSDEEQEFVQDTIDAIDEMAKFDDELTHMISSTLDAEKKRPKVA